MPYKSASARHIEDLQQQLLERERQLAEALSAKANARVAESNKKLEAERNAATIAEKEKARIAAWKLHNFDVAVKERPNQSLDWTAIDHVGEGWPTPEAEADWRSGHPAAASAVAAVSQAAVSDTKLGKMLAELEKTRARLEAS